MCLPSFFLSFRHLSPSTRLRWRPAGLPLTYPNAGQVLRRGVVRAPRQPLGDPHVLLPLALLPQPRRRAPPLPHTPSLRSASPTINPSHPACWKQAKDTRKSGPETPETTETRPAGIFSAAQPLNPLAGANLAYVGYCTSDAYAGDAKITDKDYSIVRPGPPDTPEDPPRRQASSCVRLLTSRPNPPSAPLPLQSFRGSRVVPAVLKALNANHGMGAMFDGLNTKIVLAGCGTGALGALFNLARGTPRTPTDSLPQTCPHVSARDRHGQSVGD